MARKKKQKKLSDIFSKKSSKGSLSSIFTSKKKGSGLSAIFTSKKKGQGIADRVFGKTKKRDNYSFSGGGGGGIFGGIFGNSYSRLDDTPSYSNMASFLAAHDMNPANREHMLYYLMHFEGQSEVRSVIAETAGRGFGFTNRAAWAYQQWEKYKQNPMTSEILGHMSKRDVSLDMVGAFTDSFFGNGVPKGVSYYIQDAYLEAKKVLSKNHEVQD